MCVRVCVRVCTCVYVCVRGRVRESVSGLLGVDDQGIYHYHSFEFGDAWTGLLTNDPDYETNAIPYLSSGLTHDDGHSKILGWSFDVSRGSAADECMKAGTLTQSALRLLCFTGLPGVWSLRLLGCH